MRSFSKLDYSLFPTSQVSFFPSLWNSFDWSYVSSPSNGEGWGEGSSGISRKLLGGLVVFTMLLWTSLAFAQLPSEGEGPQELPKPTFKTTPPLFQEWNFNNDPVNAPPPGFSSETVGGELSGLWEVKAEPSAPSRPQALVFKSGCQQESCYHLFLADDTNVAYLDLSVRMKMVLGESTGKAGLVFGAQDSRNFYAIVVTPKTNILEGFLVQDGVPKTLGTGPVVPRDESEWHFLRIHRVSLISHDLIDVYFDNHMILSLSDSSFQEGQVGLVTFGKGAFAFDNLRAMELLTERPLSRPPAY